MSIESRIWCVCQWTSTIDTCPSCAILKMGFMDGNMSWMIPVLRSKYITVPTRTSHRCLSFFVRLSLCCYHHWCCLQTETQWTVLGRRERCNFHPCINLKMQKKKKKKRSVVGPRCVDGRGVLSYFYSCLPL